MKTLTKILALFFITAIFAFVSSTADFPVTEFRGHFAAATTNGIIVGPPPLPTDPIPPAPGRPLIEVTNPLWIEMGSGDRRTIGFTIRNMGADRANAIVTTVDLSGARGITGVFRDDNHNISTMASRSERVFNFQITVNDSVEDGFHNLVFNHEYLNVRNELIRSSSTVTIRVNNQGGHVSLRNISSTPSRVTPGQDFNLTAVIQNDGNAAIRDVSLSIVSGMASDGIFLRESTSVVSIADLAARTNQNISIGFTSSSRASSGAYPLELELSFIDGSGERHAQRQTFFVSLAAEADTENAADVIITSITRPTAAVNVDQQFDMVVTLHNTGENAASNLRVEAITEADRSIVPRSTSRLFVPRLEPGAQSQLTFSFSATELSSTRSYDIGFGVTYESGIENNDGSNETISFTQFQGVSVFNPDPPDDPDDDEPNRISTPRIIVSNYVSNPLIVQAGREFDLELTFLNTSSDRVVRNIRVTLTVEDEVTAGTERRGSVFTPVGRSSTFFIDRIDPRNEVTEHIRFFTLPDAPPRNYIINVNFEYEDVDNNPFEARESIGINVKQITRLDTSEIFMPPSMQAWSPFFFNFELFNTGRVTLNNLMIRIEGNFTAQQSSTFFGSLSPGSMDFFDNTITPTEPGSQQLAIVISYEDDTGELIEERREFYIEVFEMDFGDGDFAMMPDFGSDMVWDDNLMMFVPRAQGLGTWAIVGIAVGGVVVAGGAVVLVIRHKRKKSREILGDLDE